MKFIACLLACVILPVLAQTPATSTQSELDTKQKALQTRGTEALDRERVRSKEDLCGKAGPSDLSYGNCYSAEGKVTDADYAEYVRVIGALLRLPSVPTAPLGAPKRLDFDDAEQTWLIYRKRSCMAMTYQWEGGTLGRVNYPKCLLTVTWDHMNELAGLYSGLWN
jgi:uncharacterized protein YecT (DUF1311 family)